MENRIPPINTFVFDNKNENYEVLNSLIFKLNSLGENLTQELLRKIYDKLRERIGSENVLSLAKNAQEEIIYIFEFDLHKDEQFVSGKSENGIPYLIKTKEDDKW